MRHFAVALDIVAENEDEVRLRLDDGESFSGAEIVSITPGEVVGDEDEEEEEEYKEDEEGIV